MAGKSKQQKKVRAKTRKQLNDELRQKLIRRAVASKPGDMANNNNEPSPPSAETVNEDAQKDEQMMAGAEDMIRQRQDTIQQLEDETADLQLEVDTEPFDPQEAMAKLLKGNNAG